MVAGDEARIRSALAEIADFQPIMRRVLDASLVLLSQADGAALELDDGHGHMVYVCARGSLEPFAGLRLRLEGSLSGLAVQSRAPLTCRDSDTDPRVDREACRRVGAASMICVPLHRREETLGVLKVSSKSKGSFSEGDAEILANLSHLMAAAVGGASDIVRATTALLAQAPSAEGLAPGVGEFIADVVAPGLADRVSARARIERVLESGSIRIVAQPIVDLSSGRVAGVEALARFPDTPRRGPDAWFAEAHSVGLGAELECLALRRALSVIDRLPGDVFLAVNAGPTAVACPAFPQALDGVALDRVVLELTEHVVVDDYAALRECLKDLRSRGLRVSVDDMGAGVASLAHVLKLAPDSIKLDLSLVSGIDHDLSRRALAAALVAFAKDVSATVVAEGLETQGELQTLRTLGVPLGQGYYLARPAPVQLMHAVSRAPMRTRRSWVTDYQQALPAAG